MKSNHMQACLLYFLLCYINLNNGDESATLSGLFATNTCDVGDENCKKVLKDQEIDIVKTVEPSNDFTENNPPVGHLKKLGEHANPILGEITELPYMINGKDFYDNFIRKRTPVVFRNVTHDWTATQQWKNETYLLEKYSDVIFDVEMGKVYNRSLNPRKTLDFKEFLALYRNTTMYLDSPFPQSALMEDLQLPLMMQCQKLHEAFASMHFLFSSGGTSCPLHVDGYENFLTLFSGQKVVYLISPKYIDHLYMLENTDFPGLSPISPESVDLLKYPKFDVVPFHKLVLEAGDMLYIPIGWFHQVRSFKSPNIATSMWFNSFSTENEEVDFLDATKQELMFEKLISNLPSTIDCSHQNVQMYSLQQLSVVKADNETTRVEDDVEEIFVNETVVYKEILPGEGAIYVGSDDSWIYAFDIETGDVRWKVKTAQDTGSTCAFSNDESLVYCGADDGYLRAISASNGHVVWTFKAEKQIIPSTCVDRNNNIYTASLDEFIYVLNPNGTLKWKKKLGNPVWEAPIWSSPILYEEMGIVYIAAKRPRSSNVFAFDMETGKVIWKSNVLGGVTATLRLSKSTNELFVCSHYADVYRFDAKNGESDKIIGLSQTDGITSSPAVNVENRVIYVQMDSGRLVAIHMDEKKVIWDIETGKKDPHDANSSPLLSVDKSVIYVGGGNGTMYSIHTTNGDVNWKTDIGTNVFFSSPRLDKNNILYVGSFEGPLYALYSESGKIKWSAHTDGPLVGTALITKSFV